MANDVIDRYQILEKIGAGGMGTVYLAWDREIQRDVALKWLPAYFSQDDNFTERFKREARVVARLEHPHIVPIYDVGENEGRPFIIMRLLKGGTLRDQIGKPKFNLAALVNALEQIGDALAAAHARSIIHRDIKPGNILFDEHGSAFLSDFGIAKVLDSATQLTGSGFIGTPAYMSPEQFIGQSIDGRSDQYSLAVVIYEALTGDLPFTGNTAQMMYKHINVAPPDIDLDQHPIPGSFNPVLQKALSKNPNDRYARIPDFTSALRIALRQEPNAAILPLVAGAGLIPTPDKQEIPPQPAEVEPDTRIIQQHYRDGLQAMSRSDWAAAIVAFDKVLQADAGYGNAAEFKQQAQTNLQQAQPPAESEKPTTVDPPRSTESEEEEDGAGLAAAGAIGMTAAGAAALASDLDKTSLDPPQAESDDPKQAAEEDLEATSLDLPPGAFAAAAAAAAKADPDLDKTALDLPPAAAQEADVDKTTLDLPPAAAMGAAAAAGEATRKPISGVAPSQQAAGQATAPPPSQESKGRPIWIIVAALILLLLLCGGAAYAAASFFIIDPEQTTTETQLGGESVAAIGVDVSSEEVEDPGQEEQAAAGAEPTDTAESEAPTEVPPTPTEEPTEAPAVVVEDTEAPPSPSPEMPTETPEPQAATVRVNVSSANVRRGPGTLYAVLQPVFEDDLAMIIAGNSDGSWYLVEFEDGSRGWISEVVVELVEGSSVASIEVAATIPVAPTLTPVPPTPTRIIVPTSPPPPSGGGGDGGGGGGDGGGDDDDDDDGGGGDGGGGDPPPAYTAEPP